MKTPFRDSIIDMIGHWPQLGSDPPVMVEMNEEGWWCVSLGESTEKVGPCCFNPKYTLYRLEAYRGPLSGMGF